MFDFLKKLLTDSKSQPASAANPQAVVLDSALSSVEMPRMDVPYVDLIQQLWGDGVSSPGSIETTFDLAKPFLLSPEKTVLNVSSGLGGHDRALAEYYKTYVYGLERNKELVDVGQKLSKASKFGRNCTLTHYNPEQFGFEKKIDAVMCRELFYTLVDKNDFISKLIKRVKSRGHIMITDFTCDDPEHANSPSIQKWAKANPYPVNMLSVSGMVQLIESHGLDVRINEDKTKQYRNEMFSGLARLTEFLKGKKLTAQSRELILKEVDYWESVETVLNDKVRNTRFYAIKKS